MTSLSSPLQAIVDLFAGPLQGVRFADIDGEGLNTLATEVDNLGSEVETLEAQVSGLREVLAQKQEALLVLAQQALAYARIYAESDEALSAELNEITLPRATKPRKSASLKSPSERGAKGSKEEAQNSERDADVQLPEVDSTEPSRPKRKLSAVNQAPPQPASETEIEDEVAVPAKGARRKLPARSGRATR